MASEGDITHATTRKVFSFLMLSALLPLCIYSLCLFQNSMPYKVTNFYDMVTK